MMLALWTLFAAYGGGGSNGGGGGGYGGSGGSSALYWVVVAIIAVVVLAVAVWLITRIRARRSSNAMRGPESHTIDRAA
jgi:hypothetical protein